LEHDLSVARSIQQSLLPSTTPEIAGFQIAGWNQPADQTGGDYYDWQVLPNGKVVVALADVTGHGIGPRCWPQFAVRMRDLTSESVTGC